VCSRTEHLAAAGLTTQGLGVFLDALAAFAEPVETHYLWRPQLRDPADQVLEAAVNAGAQAIVTFNLRDFGRTPAAFGINVLLPRDALRSLTK
jgi:PIN domain-containing protein